MFRNYLTCFVILFFVVMTINAQSDPVSETEDTVVLENDLLYGKDWKLKKMEPTFDNKIKLVLNFEKLTNQLKVVKHVESEPVLKGTQLVKTINKGVDYYQWNYMASVVEYDGDDIKSVKYDYTKIQFEGYEFKISTLTAKELVLEVLKAPKAVFGKSINDIKYVYFEH